MNLDLDDIAEMNIQTLGIDTRIEAGREEIRRMAFVEDAISDEDAIESMLYPYGSPSKWELFYDKWFTMNLNKSSSYLMILTLCVSDPFIWAYNKVK